MSCPVCLGECRVLHEAFCPLAVPVDAERLARVIHAGWNGAAKHGKFTDRCICNALADAILRGMSKMAPKPSLDKVIDEFVSA